MLNTKVLDYHIHLYFDEKTIGVAQSICSQVKERFDVEIGRFHEKSVGPHPR